MIKSCILLLLPLLLFGCIDSTSQQDNSQLDTMKEEAEARTLQQAEENSSMISYDDYQALFETAVTDLTIENFHLSDSTIGFDVTSIDKDLSFGTREWLTKDGTYYTMEPESTQETLFFENEEQSVLLTITLSYTGNYIGNDMVYYNITSGYDINDHLAATTDIITLSYKNLIVTILQTSSKTADMDITQNAAKELVDFLQKY